MAIFPLGGCVISLRTIWDQRGSLGVHLCQKDPKSVKKWLSYGYFSTERLRDFIENHKGPQRILGCSFVPKRFKIGQETAELWQFFPLGGCVISLRTAWDQRGSSGVHLCQKDSKSVKKWLSYGLSCRSQ